MGIRMKGLSRSLGLCGGCLLLMVESAALCGCSTSPDSADALNALRFSAAAKSYVQVDNFTVPHDFTFEAWIKPASMAGEVVILGG